MKLQKSDPTQLLLEQLEKLRAGKKSWYDIFKVRVPDFVEKIELVFTANKAVQKAFEQIVSDFYERPDYWSQLFSAVFTTTQVEQFGTITGAQVNPIVASQFVELSDRELAVGYIDKSRLREIKISIFETLQGDIGYQTASKFYKQYFSRTASDEEIIFFWHLILNSVIRNLYDLTTEESVKQAIQQRKWFIEYNTPRLENILASTIDVQMQIKLRFPRKKEVVSIQPFDFYADNLKDLAQQILIDASSNWVFQLPIQIVKGDEIRMAFVNGPRYVARNFTRNKTRILEQGKSFVYAKLWIQNFMKQNEFETFLYSATPNYTLAYQPITIEMDEKPTKEYEIRTIQKKTAQEYVQNFHSHIPMMNYRGVVYTIGAFDDKGEIVGALVLNTSAAPPKDSPGQYHIIEISRVIVPEKYRQEGISKMLTQWVLDNKWQFNRSQFQETNVITFSLVEQTGTLYTKVDTLYPVSLLRPREKPGARVNPAALKWKIRWESNPYKPETVRPWLKDLHPLYMKVFRGIDTWSNRPIPRTLKAKHLAPFKTRAALEDVMWLFGVPRNLYKNRNKKPIPLADQKELVVKRINKLLIPKLQVSSTPK
jgi:hypothetical protein